MVNSGAIRLQLADSHTATHDVFHVSDLRPWFKLADRVLDVEYPEVKGHPALKKIVHDLYRKQCGRAHANASPHDRLAAYIVVRVDGSTEWIPLHRCYNSESTGAQRPAGSVCAHAGDGRPYLA